MSNFAITADEVKKILAQAKHLTQEIERRRYDAEIWLEFFEKLPEECVTKILKEHECENDQSGLADLVADSAENSNAIYETVVEYMKAYAGQDDDTPNAFEALTKSVRSFDRECSKSCWPVKGSPAKKARFNLTSAANVTSAFEDSPPTSPVKKTRIQQYRIKDIQNESTIIVDAILVQGRVHFHTGYSSSYQEFFLIFQGWVQHYDPLLPPVGFL